MQIFPRERPEFLDKIKVEELTLEQGELKGHLKGALRDLPISIPEGTRSGRIPVRV